MSTLSLPENLIPAGLITIEDSRPSTDEIREWLLTRNGDIQHGITTQAAITAAVLHNHQIMQQQRALETAKQQHHLDEGSALLASRILAASLKELRAVDDGR
jgi:hypothetical protein